jgi:hypothetical protein
MSYLFHMEYDEMRTYNRNTMSSPMHDFKQPGVDPVRDPARRLPTGEVGTVVDDHRSAPVSTGEIGGPSGPEPTRYGDWEKNGRCIDF